MVRHKIGVDSEIGGKLSIEAKNRKQAQMTVC